MKILKYLFLIAILLSIGLSVFVSTQSAQFKISKSKIIKTPRTEIYNYVNDFKNWENFITSSKTLKKVVLSKKTSGKDSKINFSDFESKIIYQTISNSENAVINQIKTFNGVKSMVAWTFKDTLGGTKVTIKNEGKVDFKTKVSSFFKGGITTKIGNEIELDLENLNKTLHFELDTFEVKINGIVKQDSTFYLQRAIICYEKDVPNNVKLLLPQIQKYIAQKNIVPSGKPFINLLKNNLGGRIVQLSVCIPVKDSVFTSPKGVFKFGYLEKYNGLKGTLKGNYSHILKLWTALNSEINKNKISTNTNGNYFEIYKVGISETKAQSNWITEIIIPLEKVKPKYIRVKRAEGDTTREPGDSKPSDVNLVPEPETTSKIN